MNDENKEEFVSTTAENLTKKANALKRLLLKIDGLLIKDWKIIFFAYFIFALSINISWINTSNSYDALLRLYEERNTTNIYVGHELANYLFLWLPLIIGVVWKKIFHPND